MATAGKKLVEEFSLANTREELTQRYGVKYRVTTALDEGQLVKLRRAVPDGVVQCTQRRASAHPLHTATSEVVYQKLFCLAGKRPLIEVGPNLAAHLRQAPLDSHCCFKLDNGRDQSRFLNNFRNASMNDKNRVQLRAIKLGFDHRRPNQYACFEGTENCEIKRSVIIGNFSFHDIPIASWPEIMAKHGADTMFLSLMDLSASLTEWNFVDKEWEFAFQVSTTKFSSEPKLEDSDQIDVWFQDGETTDPSLHYTHDYRNIRNILTTPVIASPHGNLIIEQIEKVGPAIILRVSRSNLPVDQVKFRRTNGLEHFTRMYSLEYIRQNSYQLRPWGYSKQINSAWAPCNRRYTREANFFLVKSAELQRVINFCVSKKDDELNFGMIVQYIRAQMTTISVGENFLRPGWKLSHTELHDIAEVIFVYCVAKRILRFQRVGSEIKKIQRQIDAPWWTEFVLTISKVWKNWTNGWKDADQIQEKVKILESVVEAVEGADYTGEATAGAPIVVNVDSYFNAMNKPGASVETRTELPSSMLSKDSPDEVYGVYPGEPIAPPLELIEPYLQGLEQSIQTSKDKLQEVLTGAAEAIHRDLQDILAGEFVARNVQMYRGDNEGKPGWSPTVVDGGPGTGKSRKIVQECTDEDLIITQTKVAQEDLQAKVKAAGKKTKVLTPHLAIKCLSEAKREIIRGTAQGFCQDVTQTKTVRKAIPHHTLMSCPTAPIEAKDTKAKVMELAEFIPELTTDPVILWGGADGKGGNPMRAWIENHRGIIEEDHDPRHPDAENRSQATIQHIPRNQDFTGVVFSDIYCPSQNPKLNGIPLLCQKYPNAKIIIAKLTWSTASQIASLEPMLVTSSRKAKFFKLKASQNSSEVWMALVKIHPRDVIHPADDGVLLEHQINRDLPEDVQDRLELLTAEEREYKGDQGNYVQAGDLMYSFNLCLNEIHNNHVFKGAPRRFAHGCYINMESRAEQLHCLVADPFRRVWVDEAFLAHAGYIRIVNIYQKDLVLVGDPRQIGYIERNLEGLDTEAKEELQLQKYISGLHVTSLKNCYRCPQDIVNWLNSHCGYDLVAKSPVVSSVFRVDGIDRHSAHLLTCTQSDKVMAATQVAKVNTVHEMQGSTLRTAALDLKEDNITFFHEHTSHLVVAMTRHTDKLFLRSEDPGNFLVNLSAHPMLENQLDAFNHMIPVSFEKFSEPQLAFVPMSDMPKAEVTRIFDPVEVADALGGVLGRSEGPPVGIVCVNNTQIPVEDFKAKITIGDLDKPELIETVRVLQPEVAYTKDFKAQDKPGTVSTAGRRYGKKSKNASRQKTKEVSELLESTIWNKFIDKEKFCVTEDDMNEALAEYLGTIQAKDQEKVIDELLGSKPVWLPKFFQKQIQKYKEGLLFPQSDKASQGIVAWSKEANSLFCVMYRAMMKAMLRAPKKGVVFGCNKSQKEVEKEFVSQIPSGAKFIETDIAEFDSMQVAATLDMEIAVTKWGMRKIQGAHAALLPLYREMRTKRNCSMPNLISFTLENMKDSGEPATLLGNTLVNAATIGISYDWDEGVIGVQGDDGAIASPSIRKREVPPVVHEVMNIEFKLRESDVAQLCGYIYGAEGSAPDIVRTAAKLMSKTYSTRVVKGVDQGEEYFDALKLSVCDLIKPDTEMQEELRWIALNVAYHKLAEKDVVSMLNFLKTYRHMSWTQFLKHTTIADRMSVNFHPFDQIVSVDGYKAGQFLPTDICSDSSRPRFPCKNYM